MLSPYPLNRSQGVIVAQSLIKNSFANYLCNTETITPNIATNPVNMNISQNEKVYPQIVTGICINFKGTVKSKYAKSLILIIYPLTNITIAITTIVPTNPINNIHISEGKKLNNSL